MLIKSLGMDPKEGSETARMLAGIDPRFGRIVRIAARICGASHAYMSICDGELLLHKAKLSPGPTQEFIEDHFVHHIITSDSPLVIQDTTATPRYANHPMVTGTDQIRFFAGVPVHTPNLGLVGCLYIMDSELKQFDDADLEDLRDIGHIAGDLIEQISETETAFQPPQIVPNSRQFSEHFASAIGQAFMKDYSLGVMLIEVSKVDTLDHPDVDLVWINRSGAAHLSVLHPGGRKVALDRLLPPETVKPLTEALINVTDMPRLRQMRFPVTRGSRTEHFDAKMVPCGHQIAVLFSNITETVDTELHAIKTVELFRQMTGLISHDMRGPLRRICQFIDILNEEGAIQSPEHAEFFQIVQSQARSLTDLIVNSVHYSRTLINRPEPTPISVKRAVEEGFTLSMNSGEYGAVAFEALGSWGTTFADQKLLNEAFRSVFSTMLEFRRPMRRPEIKISAEMAGGRQQIQITDNSDLVQENIGGQLFNFRARRPLPSGDQRMVLGFSLASEIIQDMGGDVMCDTSYKNGLCILIDLPLGRSQNPDRS